MMKLRTAALFGVLVLVVASAAQAGTVSYEFTAEIPDVLGNTRGIFAGTTEFTGEIAWDPDGYTTEALNTYGHDYTGPYGSFINWIFRVNGTTYRALDSTPGIRDQIYINKFPDSVRGQDEFSIQSHSDTPPGGVIWPLYALTFSDTEHGMYVETTMPTRLPDLSHFSGGPNDSAWVSMRLSDGSLIAGQLRTLDLVPGSTVPLPSAVWLGFGLLGIIGAVKGRQRFNAHLHGEAA